MSLLVLDKIVTAATGAAGLAATQIVSTVETPTDNLVQEVVKIAVQIIIAVATLIGLFKKKKAK